MTRAKKTKKTNLKHHKSTYRARRIPVRVAHHIHTGKRLPFYCTSYAVLFFLIAFTTGLVLYVSNSAAADQQSGTIGLTGVIPAPPPDTAARIETPQNGARFNQSEIEVSGSCLEDTYVEIYRNNAFAGMAACQTGGSFDLLITIIPGANDLVAKIRDNLGQYGPPSDTVRVYLDIPAAVPAQGVSVPGGRPRPVVPGEQSVPPALLPLQIYTKPVQQAVGLNQTIKIDYEVDGDQPPYAITIDWGDGTPVTLISHPASGDFSASHTMKQAGQRVVRISGLGAAGGRASIQTIVVVQPDGSIVPATTSECRPDGSAFLGTTCQARSPLELITTWLWPPLVIASLMTLSFWFGEKFVYTHRPVRRA